jgi:hypothetical protein
MQRDERQRAIDAFQLANDFVADLVTGTGIFGIAKAIRAAIMMVIGEHTKSEKVERLLRRMTYFYLIITLAKYLEWYARFKDIIPRESREGCKRLYVKLSEKFQLRKFRNKVVAHIIDDDTGKPLTYEEEDKLIQEFMDKVKEDLNSSMTPDWREKIKKIPIELDIFCLWINSQGANSQDPISTIEKARDAIRKRYNLTDEELFPGLHSL